jgi:hypothetical protein
LGNTLRRYEDRVGTQYGLDAITTAPHFSLVAPEAHVAYVRDTRQLLDTTVRLCFVSLLAAVLTVAALVTDGWWLLIALVSYGLAYLATAPRSPRRTSTAPPSRRSSTSIASRCTNGSAFAGLGTRTRSGRPTPN